MGINYYISIGIASFFILGFLFFLLFKFDNKNLSHETTERKRSFVSNAAFREYWYWMTRPVKDFLIRKKVTPNTLTWLGFIVLIFAGYAFSIGQFATGAYLVILGSTLDVFDGQLARFHNMSTKAGSFLDSTLDRVGEMFLFFGLLWFFRDDVFWISMVYVAVCSSQLVSYARARAEGLGVECKGGFFQRAERMIVFSVICGLIPFFERAGISNVLIMKISISIIVAGSLQTALSRVAQIYKKMSPAAKLSS